jgi:GDP-L-fucose synthase
MLELKNKKILVTGGSGFLGSHVIDNLLTKRQVPPENLFYPSSQELNLTKYENCQKAVKNQDVVIHIAARVGGIGFSKNKPGEIFYDNIMMGVQLMETARQAGVEKFTAIGTVCAYPKITPLPFREENLWDGYPEETHAAYALSKKMYLVQGQAYAQQYNFNSIHLLLVNMYGPRDNFDLENSHVIPALIRKVLTAQKQKKDYIEVWGTGSATREFLYVADAAEAIVLATEKYNKVSPINIGSGQEISIKDLVELIAKMMNFKGKLKWDTTKPDGQPKRCLDTSKAKREFGFQAQTLFKDGLQKTINWYINYAKS